MAWLITEKTLKNIGVENIGVGVVTLTLKLLVAERKHWGRSENIGVGVVTLTPKLLIANKHAVGQEKPLREINNGTVPTKREPTKAGSLFFISCVLRTLN